MSARAHPRFSFMPFVIGNAAIIFLLLVDITNSTNGVILKQVYWGHDFVNVWTSGKLVIAQRLDLLYDPILYQRFQKMLFGPLGPHNYSYPPLTLPLMVPFALLPYWLALVVWLAGTAWLFVKAATPWWQDSTGWPGIFILLTPAATINIWAGHYGFLIGALLLFGWRALDAKKPWLAGLCFGLLAIKPHVALFLPLVLLIRGEGRAIMAAALTAIMLILISLMMFGPQPWRDFLAITAGMQSGMIDAQHAFFGKMSTSTSTALFALHAPLPLVIAGQAAMAISGIVMVARAARLAQTRDIALLAATATFLVLPYAFNYDLTVSAMGAATMMGAAALLPIERWLSILGFMAAQLGLILAMLGMPVMPLLLLGLAIVQYRVARRKDLPPIAPAQQAKP